MFVLWGLAGLAFFLDCCRVPVLTSLAVLFFAANFLADYSTITGDHYLTSYEVDKRVTLLTPDRILKNFQNRSRMQSAGDLNSGSAKRRGR